MKHIGWLALPILAACTAGNGIPHGSISGDETALSTYASCDALEADLKDSLAAEVTAAFEQSKAGRGYPTPVAQGPGGVEDSSGGIRQEGTDYSGTNNQESGVDEADIVKTDGFHIYVMNGDRLHIFGVPQFGTLIPESVTEIEGNPTALLVDKVSARAAVFSSIYPQGVPEGHPVRDAIAVPGPSGPAFRVASMVKITVLDVSDASSPTLVREVYLEGNYAAARLIGGSVRLAGFTFLDFPTVDAWTYNQIDLSDDERQARAKEAIEALTLEDVTPRIYERLPGGSFDVHTLAEGDCRSFARPSDSHGRSITSILTLDLRAAVFHLDADEIVSNAGTVYASLSDLYIAESSNDWWWYWWNPADPEKTNIHQFDISDAGETRYVASGRVHGQVRDSFSMSEKDGNLRVATTTGANSWGWATPVDIGIVAPSDDVAPPETENHLLVLAPDGGRLKTIGRLDGIAKGEHLFASRFLGDRGYLVTARFVDPLFSLDLSDPTDPRLLGELEVPGVSTYLQSIGEGRLLAVGWGTSDESTIDESRTQVSLFDITDDAHPGLVDTESLAVENGWSFSTAVFEHKAFQYWAPRRLLALPVSSYDSTSTSYTYSSQLKLIRVDDDALTAYGAIDHSRFYNSDPGTYYSLTDISRSIFMGDFIYAISDRGITANRIGDLSEVAAEPLPGYLPGDVYWAY